MLFKKDSKYYKKQQTRDHELRQRAREKLDQFKKISQQEVETAEKHADVYINDCEKRRNLNKILVHIDMDAFYANVEIRDNPKLVDKPIAVGSDSMLVLEIAYIHNFLLF